MGEEKGLLPLKLQSPYVQLIVSLLVILIVSSFLLVLISLAGKVIFGVSASSIDTSSEILSLSQRAFLKFIQAMSQVSIFLIPGLVISRLMSGNIAEWQGLRRHIPPASIPLVLLLAISIIPLTSMTGILNSRMVLPEMFNSLEIWMQAKEQEASDLTRHLIYAANRGGLVMNIIILAVIPAVGEELLFRGVIQQIIQKWTGKGILAVILTALIFSTLHLQFYGFLPRLILGIVFGLLFLWGKSVLIPVIAHFLNNLIPVVVSYSAGWDNLNENLGSYVPADLASIIIIVVLPVGLLLLIRESLLAKR